MASRRATQKIRLARRREGWRPDPNQATRKSPRPTGAAAPDQLRVVATITILGDMVEQVGAGRVALTTLIGPDGDAHAFEPTPADVKTLSTADLVVVNGLGLEGWLDRLIAASGYKGPVVVASDGVTPRQMEEDGATVVDPHAWQDLKNGHRYVANIEAALAAADRGDVATLDAIMARMQAARAMVAAAEAP